MHTAPDSNLGISLGCIEVFDLLVDFLESYFRVTFRSVQRYFTKLVSAWVIWILHELILLCLFLLTFLETFLLFRFLISFIKGSGLLLSLLFSFFS